MQLSLKWKRCLGGQRHLLFLLTLYSGKGGFCLKEETKKRIELGRHQEVHHLGI